MLFLKTYWKDFLKTTIFLLIILLIIEIIKINFNQYLSGFQDLLIFNDKFNTMDKLQTIQILVTLFGFLFAVWRLYLLKENEQNNFVKIYIETQEVNYGFKIKTKVENPVNKKKFIKTAFLIISKPEENFLELLSLEVNFTFSKTNELIIMNSRNDIFNENLIFINLKYYCYENVRVGNEILAYTCTLTNRLLSDKNFIAGLYDVRFFVFSSESHLHRCVHDTLYFGLDTNHELNNPITPTKYPNKKLTK